MRFAELESRDVAIWGLGREGRAALAALRRRFPDKSLTLYCKREEAEQARAQIDSRIRLVETAPGTEALAYGHLGDGNVHLHVLAPPGSERAAWEARDGKAISRQVHEMVTAWDGSISAEHGIGALKREELERLADPVHLALMRAVKRALDPAGLLNPGKLVTLAPPAASA